MTDNASEEPPSKGTCAGCGGQDATFLCGRCQRAFFCSKDCLRSAWPRHKIECVQVAEPAIENSSVPATSSTAPSTTAPFAPSLRADSNDPPYILRGRGKLGHLVPPGGVRIGVVSTLRDVEDQFHLWLEWFRIVGFSHLFLYFDDPSRDEASIEEARAIYSADFVSFALNTPELRKEWPTLRSWSKFSAHTDDRMCRQLLNLAHGFSRASKCQPGAPEEVDWMLHLDHDELFLPPPQGLQTHFKHLENLGCKLCLYQNLEAAPEDHTLTPFLDVSMFKVPSGRMPKTPLGAAGTNFWAKRTAAGNYFLYYDNGKSAVRVRQRSGTEIAPVSVHLLYPPEDLEDLMVGGKAWTTFAPQELPEMNLGWLSSRHEEVVVGAKVLHYPATHFDRLFRKYDHLKDFPSVRFGGDLVIPPSFHLEARDCYLRHRDAGERVQREQIKELLESVAFLRTPEEVQSQIETGSVVVIESVRESLRRGAWQSPGLLRQTFDQMMQRQPSAEGMDRIRRMPRVDAEILLAGSAGGLLKMLEPGLDLLVQRLESVGWVACSLGMHAKLIDRALTEAKGLMQRMSPGTTVIQNEVIDQKLPNAKRGDKILFMQEQGLTGPKAAKGPAPTLALLEGAMTDIGMQLDTRLQRSKLALRITERCDGMLACYNGNGAAYGAHIDNADGDGRVDGRVLTAVLYLNPGWDRRNGGELAIFQPESGQLGDEDVVGRWHTISPEAGTLVLFRADETLHEVRPSLEQRFALSLWFCGQSVNYGGSQM
eukprot:TRINITY_DN30112_c0_g1_i1.p1 TRINITY_DN30112_c0_g1~~TRINITY_DN30112_c0_g1_i1.p1  ORF type:complete len:765 (+),score=105.04 TRINITY_DN30112_c0_g1_i1:49-2343(+)